MSSPTAIYDFAINNIDGAPFDLSALRSNGCRAVLIVNVASQCGLTDNNYRELQQMYEKLHGKGLEILAVINRPFQSLNCNPFSHYFIIPIQFPCNDFGAQEPHGPAEICSFVASYHVSFPMMEKVRVLGEDAHPLFKHLVAESGGAPIKWNFGKFLVDASTGALAKRYAPMQSPLSFEEDVLALLNK
jgi:glutathione peroxidase